MRISNLRRKKLIDALEALNKTVGGEMKDITEAEQAVLNNLPKIGIYLEFGDSNNTWYFTDLKGDEIEL